MSGYYVGGWRQVADHTDGSSAHEENLSFKRSCSIFAVSDDGSRGFQSVRGLISTAKIGQVEGSNA